MPMEVSELDLDGVGEELGETRDETKLREFMVSSRSAEP